MPLKCPLCRKEYFHDRKICQVCETKLIYSGLIQDDDNKSQKWNCATFLDFDGLTFGKHKPDDANIKIASEPKFSDFKPKNDYTWNCNSISKFKKFLTLKSGISQMRSIKKLSTINPRFLKREFNNFLTYE
ncbi:MAG: hypothetical protein ACFE9Z_04780 [Promethearchaeota archaeon]